ncbi:MAG: ATP-binding cassette domain-containing protein [Rikenellaceae bacterium]
MNQITLNNLTPKYFTESKANEVSGIWNSTLTINRGESCLIRANSGRGKTSLCNFLYGLRNDYNGSILFDQKDISSFSVNKWIKYRKRYLSILFQELRLFSELTVIENIELKNRLTNFKQPKEILHLLESLGIESKVNQKVGELSLGEQQRVAFVRSLCQPFHFILADEPVSHLDSDNGTIMAELLYKEAHKQGAGIIATSVGNNLNIQYDKTLHL